MWQRLAELRMVGEDAEQAGRRRGGEPMTPCAGLGSPPWACAELGSVLCSQLASTPMTTAPRHHAHWSLGLLSWSSSLILHSTEGFRQVCIRQAV